MNAVFLLSVENGMLIQENKLGEMSGAFIQSSLQLSSILYATYQMSRFELKSSDSNVQFIKWLTMVNFLSVSDHES